MKPAITLAALASLLLLVGCATTPPPETSTSAQNLDHSYVNAVDRQAAKAGVRVFWVNPPRKKGGSERAN